MACTKESNKFLLRPLEGSKIILRHPDCRNLSGEEEDEAEAEEDGEEIVILVVVIVSFTFSKPQNAAVQRLQRTNTEIQMSGVQNKIVSGLPCKCYQGHWSSDLNKLLTVLKT